MVTKKSPKQPAKPAKRVPSSVRSKAKAKISAKAASTKVDYYPNRMTVAVSALAGTLLVLFALIAVLGSN